MRTTLTLDDDLARELREIARSSGRSFKEVVNDAIRRSLRSGEKPVDALPEFVVEARECGFRRGVDILKLNSLSDELEVEDFESELPRRPERR
jgi:predicted transcriptional regulator